MKKVSLITCIVFVAVIILYALTMERVETPSVTEAPAVQEAAEENKVAPKQVEGVVTSQISPELQPPVSRAKERVTKKPFGLFVTPQNSPIQPEKFRGYHTGVDFETFSEEVDAEVAVKAICSGELKVKRFANGYGGILVQFCELNKNPVTAIYGHLKLSSVTRNIGENIEAGEVLGILGKGFSAEADGERKHLHLGIHRGNEINILGYAQNRDKLADWMDVCLYICAN